MVTRSSRGGTAFGVADDFRSTESAEIALAGQSAGAPVPNRLAAWVRVRPFELALRLAGATRSSRDLKRHLRWPSRRTSRFVRDGRSQQTDVAVSSWLHSGAAKEPVFISNSRFEFEARILREDRASCDVTSR